MRNSKILIKIELELWESGNELHLLRAACKHQPDSTWDGMAQRQSASVTEEKTSEPVKLLNAEKRNGSAFTHVSSEFFLRRWFSQPALEDDFSAAHVCQCLLRLLALKLRCVTSTWWLLGARLFKVLTAFGSPCCSLRPPFDKNQSGDGRRFRQSLLLVPCETGGVQNAAISLSGNYARPADEEPRGNSTDAGWGSIIGCLQFVFLSHTTPTVHKEGWAALGWTGSGNCLLLNSSPSDSR